MKALEAYLLALLELNQHINLTAIRDLEQARRLHIEDSGALAKLSISDPKQAIDLGSGNGFPGVWVAARYPDCRVYLVERRQKKARAIAALAVEAGLQNVTACPCDGRELLSQRPELRGRVELVTARAVGALVELVRIAAPWLAVGGDLVCWKGSSLTAEELADAGELAVASGLDAGVVIDYQLGDRANHLVRFTRRHPVKPAKKSTKKRRGGPRH